MKKSSLGFNSSFRFQRIQSINAIGNRYSFRRNRMITKAYACKQIAIYTSFLSASIFYHSKCKSRTIYRSAVHPPMSCASSRFTFRTAKPPITAGLLMDDAHRVHIPHHFHPICPRRRWLRCAGQPFRQTVIICTGKFLLHAHV